MRSRICALQMKRRKTPSPAVQAARSEGLAGIAAVREAKRVKTTSAASSDAAPFDSGTDPPPAGRFRRSCRTPPHRCSRTGHGGCSRCSGRRDGDWWKPCHSTSTSPTRREATRTRRSSLPPDVCTDAQTHSHSRIVVTAARPLAELYTHGVTAKTGSSTGIFQWTTPKRRDTSR